MSVASGGVAYRSGTAWGFLDLETMVAKPGDYCPLFGGEVTAIALDPVQPTRVYIADQQDTVWALSVRTKPKPSCRVDQRMPTGSTRGPMQLASIRGFLLGLERPEGQRALASLVALNMSQANKNKMMARSTDKNTQATLPPPPPAAVIWRRPRAAVRDWSVLQRSKESDLVALLSEDGHEIEIVEVLMSVYTASTPNNFSNFKMPVIALAVLLVLGYQYMKQKGKVAGGGGGAFSQRSKFDNADFASVLKNRRKPAGLKGGGRPAGL